MATDVEQYLDRLLRLVVFDVPEADHLLTSLRSTFPRNTFEPIQSWMDDPGDRPDSIGVWLWPQDAESLRNQSGDVLRRFVLPLVARGTPYVVGFPFASSMFERSNANTTDVTQCDFEDIGTLLCDDAEATTHGLLPDVPERTVLTPIEEMIRDALVAEGLDPQPQVRIGKYIVDFLIEINGCRIAVEADGQAYHTPEADRQRDEVLKGLGLEAVLHFTGSEIYANSASCASRVQAFLKSGIRNTRLEPRIEELDESQQEAVDHENGAVRVLAPAGSGKTRILINRAAKLVARGVHPGAILMLAFNSKACEQLTESLTALGIPTTRKILTDDAAIHCATFNAFGFRYQREIIGSTPALDSSGARQRQLMAEAMRAVGVNPGTLKAARGSDPLAEYLRALSRVRAGLEPPEEVEVEIATYRPSGTITLSCAEVLQQYSVRQVEAQVQSFDDQIYLAVMDMCTNPQHRKTIQRRYDYLLVDEFQDLNGAQLALVDILSRPARNVFVVGDDDQLIYGWRFAELDSILSFHERMPPKPWSATYTLSTNYRCSREIVEASRRLIDHNTMREKKQFKARKDAPAGSVRFYSHRDWSERAREICEFLRDQKARLGCDWRELAILCRYRSQQWLVAMALDSEKIPRTVLLSYRLFSHQAARLLRAYISLVMDPSSITAEELQFVINRPNRYIRNDDIQAMARADEPWAMLTALAETEGKGRHRPLSSFCQRVNKVSQVIHSNPNDTPLQLLSTIVTEFDLENYWEDKQPSVRETKAGTQQDDAGPMQVLAALRLFADDYSGIGQFINKWDEMLSREQSKEHMTEDDLLREENEQADRVVIGTVHSAKGREYRSVVIPDYDSDLSRMSPPQVEEERRVMYVAVTRARDSVLATIDRSKDEFHCFIRELVREPSQHEYTSLQKELDQLQDAAQSLAVELESPRKALADIDSGEAPKIAQARLADLGDLQQLEKEVASREATLASGGLRGLARRIVGTQGKLKYELAGLQKKIKEIEDLNAHISLLSSDPEAAAKPIRRRLAELEMNSAENRARRAEAADRRAAIELFFPNAAQTSAK